MIKIENAEVSGFEHAVRAMRNPMNSWDKSDSYYCGDKKDCSECQYHESPNVCCIDEDFIIGDDDIALMKRLFKAGVEHRTYARMIYLWMDITAPLYWWKEMDRYMIGKTQISTSTMHKIHAKEFTFDDFSHEHLTSEALITDTNFSYSGEAILSAIVDALNAYRREYLDTKNKLWWWQMIQLLPSSYNQKRTVSMTYETVFKIIRERTGHKLDEWNEFVEILKDLPYVMEIIEDGTETR